jgi:hypothetical protein
MAGRARPPIPLPNGLHKGCQPVIDGLTGVAREREEVRQVRRQGSVFRFPLLVLAHTFGQVHSVNRASLRVALHIGCLRCHPNFT